MTARRRGAARAALWNGELGNSGSPSRISSPRGPSLGATIQARVAPLTASDFVHVELLHGHGYHLRLARVMPSFTGAGVPRVKILCAPDAAPVEAWALVALPSGHQPCAGCRAAAASLGYVPAAGWIAAR